MKEQDVHGKTVWKETGGETPSFPVLPGTFLSSGVLNKRKGRNFPKLPIHSKEGAARFPTG